MAIISCQLCNCYFQIALSLSCSLTARDPGIDGEGVYHSGPPDRPAARLMWLCLLSFPPPPLISPVIISPPSPSGQMLASRLTAYFRRKCLAVTDRRVRLMNEILGCIKFIKMYCWEDAFAKNIHSEWQSSSLVTQRYIRCSFPDCGKDQRTLCYSALLFDSE